MKFISYITPKTNLLKTPISEEYISIPINRKSVEIIKNKAIKKKRIIKRWHISCNFFSIFFKIGCFSVINKNIKTIKRKKQY